MLKKWLCILLLFIFGLKSISVACQPLATVYLSTAKSNTGLTDNNNNLLDALLSAFSQDDADDEGLCKHVDDTVSYCQQRVCPLQQADYISVYTCTSSFPLLTTVKTTSYGRKFSLPALHHFLFRLTPF